MKHILNILFFVSVIAMISCSKLPTGKWYSSNGKQILVITKDSLSITQDPRFTKKMNSILSLDRFLPKASKDTKSPYGDIGEMMSQTTMGLNIQYNGTLKQKARNEIEVTYSSMFAKDKTVVYTYKLEHGYLYLEEKNPPKPKGIMDFINPLNEISHTWYRHEQPLSNDIDQMAQMMKGFNPEEIYKDSKAKNKPIPFKPIASNSSNPFNGTLQCESGLAAGTMNLKGTATEISMEMKYNLFGSGPMDLGKFSYKVKNKNTLELYLSPEDAKASNGSAFETAQFKIVKGKVVITGSAQLNGTWVRPK